VPFSIGLTQACGLGWDMAAPLALNGRDLSPNMIVVAGSKMQVSPLRCAPVEMTNQGLRAPVKMTHWHMEQD
jgi:hypothetical protein